jgi:hypothetical protein
LAVGLIGGFLASLWAYDRSASDESIDPRFAPKTACHGVWLEHAWVGEARDETQIRALGDKLTENKIDCIYAHVTPLADSGALDYDRMLYAGSFVDTMHRLFPEITVYAWIGMVNHEATGETVGYKFDPAEYDRMDGVKTSMIELVDTFGFDGIHIDMEPLRSGNSEFLTFLAGLHEALKSRGKPLSIAALYARLESDALVTDPSGAEVVDERKYLWSWRPEYYADIGRFVDQLVVMAYNKGAASAGDYSDFVAQQIDLIDAQIPEHVTLIVGIPSYDQYATETVASALDGIARAKDFRQKVDGMAIYAEWTTGAEEWRVWRETGLRLIPH